MSDVQLYKILAFWCIPQPMLSGISRCAVVLLYVAFNQIHSVNLTAPFNRGALLRDVSSFPYFRTGSHRNVIKDLLHRRFAANESFFPRAAIHPDGRLGCKSWNRSVSYSLCRISSNPVDSRLKLWPPKLYQLAEFSFLLVPGQAFFHIWPDCIRVGDINIFTTFFHVGFLF